MFPLPKQYLPVNNLSFHFLKSRQNYVKENENQVFREREVFIMQLHLSLISPSFRHKAKISPIIRARHKAEFILMWTIRRQKKKRNNAWCGKMSNKHEGPPGSTFWTLAGRSANTTPAAEPRATQQRKTLEFLFMFCTRLKETQRNQGTCLPVKPRSWHPPESHQPLQHGLKSSPALHLLQALWDVQPQLPFWRDSSKRSTRNK